MISFTDFVVVHCLKRKIQINYAILKIGDRQI